MDVIKKDDYKSKKIILFILIFIIIFYLFYEIKIISYFKFFIFYLKSQYELNKMKIYLKFYINKFRIIKKYSNNKNPKISVISPIFNREKFIARFIMVIQNQDFNNLEIIFIDDYSKDNSVKVIEDYKIIDKRIKLIKNKKNQGTFISRNIGVLYSKGKYVILPDSDDVLKNNIISLCYKYSEKYNYEMIRFKMYKGNGITSNINHVNIINNILDESSIYQPELSTYMFYGNNNELEIIDYYIHNKFIKKETFIKALNSLNNFYINMYITLWEDTIISFILYRTAKSFAFIKRIGYYYIKSSQSITKNILKMSELRVLFIFIFLKFLFEYSKNTKYEKDMSNHLFTEFNQKYNIENKFSKLIIKPYINIYIDVINNYL